MQPHYVRDYRRKVRKLFRTRPIDEAASFAIGGGFATVGMAQRDLLQTAGLRDDHYLIDVGCGSGRTAFALHDLAALRYLGTDVVPELVNYARSIVGRPDWRFIVVDGLDIPERDGRADLVAMFSVLTHLTAAESKRYMIDAVRVLKPGGRLVASFLDPEDEAQRRMHNGFVKQTLGRIMGTAVKNVFLRREQISAWARDLDISAEFFGPERIGQSYVVLTK